MPSQAEIHLFDIGTELLVTIMDGDAAMDVSGATDTGEKMIFLKKPDNTTLAKEAEFVSDGSDGQIKYVVEERVLDQTGTWYIQAYIELQNGSWHSSTDSFTVVENIRN
jgi:hypothetical protein